MTRSFIVQRTDRASCKALTVGQTVYDHEDHVFGKASGDPRLLGLPHRAVTLDPAGTGPFFTIPVQDIEEVATDG